MCRITYKRSLIHSHRRNPSNMSCKCSGNSILVTVSPEHWRSNAHCSPNAWRDDTQWIYRSIGSILIRPVNGTSVLWFLKKSSYENGQVNRHRLLCPGYKDEGRIGTVGPATNWKKGILNFFAITKPSAASATSNVLSKYKISMNTISYKKSCKKISLLSPPGRRWWMILTYPVISFLDF